MTDARLSGRAGQGDRLARAELFQRHFPAAYRVAFRLLGDDKGAHEAVCVGFSTAWATLPDDAQGEVRTRLLSLVAGAALDASRAGRRRRARPPRPRWTLGRV